MEAKCLKGSRNEWRLNKEGNQKNGLLVSVWLAAVDSRPVFRDTGKGEKEIITGQMVLN